MSEKLTKEKVEGVVRTAAWVSLHEGAMTELWELIEFDRDAVREETRAEMVQTRGWQIGEDCQMRIGNEWHPAVVVARAENGTLNTSSWLDVRKPVKTRPATDGEMLSRLVFRLETWDAVEKALRTDGRTLEELCADLAILTEVDE